MIDVALDPRTRRTRAMLQRGLAELMQTKNFERITVADIADAAELNRATFYDHYPDKYALLDAHVTARFDALIAERGVVFDGTCSGALSAIILAVCDFLATSTVETCAERPATQTLLEGAIVTVVRRSLLTGLQRHGGASPFQNELMAGATSWAIYGAAKEWIGQANRPEAATVVSCIASLVAPLLNTMETSP